MNGYQVVSADTRPDLERKVREAMDVGWELFGGVSVVSQSLTATFFYQDMVKQ